MKNFALVLIIALAAATLGCPASTPDEPVKEAETPSLSAEEITAITEEAYIYAYPMLDHHKTIFAYAIWKDSPAFVAPLNVLANLEKLNDHTDTQVVRPNNDTLYSSLALDLRAEPIVLSVPANPDKRYYSFQLIDAFTHNFDYIGVRATGFEAGNYAIAGPNWKGEAPEGITKVLRSNSDIALALGRTQVMGADDLQNAIAFMKGYKAQPLSAFAQTEPPPAATSKVPGFAPEMLSTPSFIALFNQLLSHVEMTDDEKPIFERFAKIGIAPGKAFDASTLSDEERAAMEKGIANAKAKIEEETMKLGERKNGWMLVSDTFGTRDDMRGRYLRRAAGAKFGIYGNTLEEAYYPETNVDETGAALDGSKHNYILHFEKEELPQVNAFWSFTMYKLPDQLFIDNPLKKYVVSSATKGLKFNKDGSLDIYIQKDSPGKGKEANWLPAHDGPFSLQSRLYWPKPETLDPLRPLPPVKVAK